METKPPLQAMPGRRLVTSRMTHVLRQSYSNVTEMYGRFAAVALPWVAKSQ